MYKNSDTGTGYFILTPEVTAFMKWNEHDLSDIFPDAFTEWIKKPLSPIIDYVSNTVSIAMISPDGSKEMTAYLTLFHRDNPEFLKLYYFNWAIDTTDANTEKFKFLYDTANEAWCWFEGLGWPDVDYDYPNNHTISDYEAIYYENSITWRSNKFAKISDLRWDKFGIKSLSDLETYLSTIFAPDVISELMLNVTAVIMILTITVKLIILFLQNSKVRYGKMKLPVNGILIFETRGIT